MPPTGTVTWMVQLALLSPALAVMVALPPPTAFTLPSSTVATLASEVLQVTVLSVASAGETVAARVASSPLLRAREALSRVMEETGITFLATATVQVALFSPALAVITADPSFTATTLPFSTVAIAALELLQVTDLSVASSGFTVAVRVACSPSTNSREVLFRVTEETGITFLATVTVHVAVLSPALAVMMAEPSFTAFTLPVLSTVAMAGLSLLQVTVLSVASSGPSVAVSWASSPSVKPRTFLSRVTEETGTVTVMAQLADCSPAWAVMVAEPPPTAFTLPSATVATASLEVVQATALSVASSGFTVAVRVTSSPFTRASSALSNVTDSTGINFLATVTLQVASISPALAVMVASPSLTAVTFPSSTVTISALEVLQVTVLSAALSGSTIAVSVYSSSSTRASSALSSVTDVTLGSPACLTENFCVTVPHLMVTRASRSSVVGLGWADTVRFTVPPAPLVGCTESQLEALVSVTSAVQG